jgi:sugar/nucleoside kinase (ribokinase family)
MNRIGKDKERFDVIGLGSCAVDLLGIVPSFPKPDTKNKMIRLVQQGGGPVGTALVTLARLGAKVSFVGKLGDDEFSRFAINEFTQEEVDTSGIVKEEKAGPYFAFVVVDEKKGSRTIWWTDQMVCRLKKKELSKDFITSCRILHLDEYDLPAALLAATWAKEKGIKTVLDAETPQKEELLSLVKLTDFLIVPEEFALGFSGATNVEKATEFFLKRGPGVVGVTQGKRGSLIRTKEKSFFQPAFNVPVVDTTGCGDVFHGGFIYGILKNWPIEVTAEFASAVAAIKCKKLGGRAGCPSFEKVKDFLLSFGSERIKSFLK